MLSLCTLAATALDPLGASVRADVWRPDLMVNGEPAPLDGRRVHIVAELSASATDAELRSVRIGGQECLNLTTDGGGGGNAEHLHWCRAHTNAAAGQQREV